MILSFSYSRKNISLKTVITLTLTLLFSSSLVQAQESLQSSDYQSIQQPLSYQKNPNIKYGYPRIFVCFEQQNSPTLADRQSIKNYITRAYEDTTALHFVGWNLCEDASTDPYSSHIRISNQDVRPHSSIGTASAGQPNNMVLNFSYIQNFNACLNQKSYCNKVIAVHEFGHALSSYHEQVRSDTPSWCTNYGMADPNTAPDYVKKDASFLSVGPASPDWDIHSTMNYCNNGCVTWAGTDYSSTYNLTWSNNGVLSDSDLSNWRAIYGSNKMSYGSGTGYSYYTDGANFSLVNTNRTSTYQRPDLYGIAWGPGTTASGKIVISAVSGTSNYQTFTTSTVLPYDLQPLTGGVFGFTMAHIDLDNTPEMVWFSRNTSANRINMFVQSGSSNWQNLVLSTQLPMESANDYKFTFADYNADGYQDLIALRMVNSTQLAITVMQGPSFANVLAQSLTPFDSGQATNCRWVAGNFYNHTASSGNIDLVCMSSDPSSSSSLVNIIALKASNSASDPYSLFPPLTVSMPTQLGSIDARYAEFGIWNDSSTTGSGKLPGDGLKIGFIKKSQASGTEVYFLNASLYF